MGSYRIARGIARRVLAPFRKKPGRDYETQIYTAAIRPGDVCYDIGVNFGAMSLLFSHLSGPNGHVYSFEPSPPMYLRLCDTARHGTARIATFPFGLADRDEPRKLFSPDDPNESGLAGLAKLPCAGPGRTRRQSRASVPGFHQDRRGGSRKVRLRWRSIVVCKAASADNAGGSIRPVGSDTRLRPHGGLHVSPESRLRNTVRVPPWSRATPDHRGGAVSD